MRRSTIAGLAGLLLACAIQADPAADNHGYGWDYDAVGETGLRLRYDDGAGEALRPPRTPPDTIAWFERVYAETAACVDVSAPAPFVILVPPGMVDPGQDGQSLGGRYYYNPPLIVVAPVPTIVGGYALPDATFRHEAVHYLLDQAGVPFATNDAHDSPLFDICT